MLNKELLEKYNIKTIVNCSIECTNMAHAFSKDYKVLNLLMKDVPTQSLTPYIEIAYATIDDSISNGESVLVNCYAGISRSSSIILYYLGRKNNWNLKTLISYLKSKNSSANPNNGFIIQLDKLLRK